MKNYKKVGRPSCLTKKLTLQIRSLYLSGLKIKNIQSRLGVNPKTWESWYKGNFQGFRSNFSNWRKAKILRQIDRGGIMKFLTMSTDVQSNSANGLEMGSQTVPDYRLLRIKLKATIFVSDMFRKFKLM